MIETRNQKNKRIVLMILGVLFLIVGLLLYILFNQNAYISKTICRLFMIPHITYEHNILTMLITYYGADLLWSVSFCLIVQLILFIKKRKTILLVICSVLGITYEIMQCFGLAAGTADIVDVIVYILGSLVAIIIIQGGKLYEEE